VRQDLEIKGFRKGSKVPTQVVVAQVGADAVKSKALQDLSDRAISYVSSGGTVALVGQSKLKGGGEAGKTLLLSVRARACLLLL
jgi:FKBP-type peptidyl-prolyl cis-trans isomerase (trigger factor)